MEYFPLPVAEIQLGDVNIENPILMVACEMWARGEKVHPARLVLREGPLPESDTFYMGVECRDEKATCLYFGQAYGVLNVNAIEVQTESILPDAKIILENEMGIQIFTGKFSLPLYAGIQGALRFCSWPTNDHRPNFK
jgi:hypothetical protein